MRGQYEELSCPFCDTGRIPCLFIPGSISIKQSRSRVIKGNKKVKSSDIWLIKSGCSVCGKSNEEVESELRKKKII